MRTLNAITALFAAGALSLATVPAASASSAQEAETGDLVNAMSSSEETELRSFFNSYGVDEPTQSELIESFEEGEPWDSLSGEEPVDVSTITENSVTTKIETFADGSITVSSTDTPSAADETSDPGEPSMAPRSVSNCQLVSSSNYHANYTNCHANVDLGVVQMGFYFDRETLNGAQGSITRGYGAHHRIIGGALSNHRVESMNSSQMRYSADFSVAFQGFPVGWTAWMQANQGTGANVWTTNN